MLGSDRFRALSWQLNDFYFCFLGILLTTAVVALGITLVTGAIFRPTSYAAFGDFRNLVLNTLPVFTLSLCNLSLLQSDVYHRTRQPVRGMDKPALARDSILLDYVSTDPFTTIVTALDKGHYRVAWGTFIALSCTSSNILVGNMFQYDTAAQTFQSTPLQAYAVLAVVLAYCIAVVLARPDPKYATGRRALENIIETLSLCYDSPLLSSKHSPEFSVQDRTDKEIHLTSQVIVERDYYQFGVYRGISGKPRLGFSTGRVGLLDNPDIDEARRHPDAIVLDDVARIKVRYGFLRFNSSWFRRPTLVSGQTSKPKRVNTVEVELGSRDAQSSEREVQRDSMGPQLAVRDDELFF